MGKFTDYYGADIRRSLQISHISTERISTLEHVTEWSGFFSSVLRSGYPLAGKSRGFSRSEYPLLQMSRIIAERISVARLF